MRIRTITENEVFYFTFVLRVADLRNMDEHLHEAGIEYQEIRYKLPTLRMVKVETNARKLNKLINIIDNYDTLEY